jgi:ABC-type lipoprotein release transport system permease subunit
MNEQERVNAAAKDALAWMDRPRWWQQALKVAGQAFVVILVVVLLVLGVNEFLALVSGHQFGWVKA